MAHAQSESESTQSQSETESAQSPPGSAARRAPGLAAPLPHSPLQGPPPIPSRVAIARGRCDDSDLRSQIGDPRTHTDVDGALISMQAVPAAPPSAPRGPACRGASDARARKGSVPHVQQGARARARGGPGPGPCPPRCAARAPSQRTYPGLADSGASTTPANPGRIGRCVSLDGGRVSPSQTHLRSVGRRPLVTSLRWRPSLGTGAPSPNPSDTSAVSGDVL